LIKGISYLSFENGLSNNESIKGISYLSFENGLSNNESIDSALIQTQSNGFEALELSVSNEGVINTNF